MDDELLIKRYQEGDTDAFGTLVGRYEDRLFRMAFGVLRDHDDARDAVQEVLIRVVRGLPGFQGQSRFSTWLYRLAYNTCIDCRRRVDRWRQRVTFDMNRVLEVATDPPEVVWEQNMQMQLIERALKELPPAQRELLTQRDWEARSNSDVARSLGLGVGALKARLHRARLALKRRIEAAYGETPSARVH